jgi:hypothetical protein
MLPEEKVGALDSAGVANGLYAQTVIDVNVSPPAEMLVADVWHCHGPKVGPVSMQTFTVRPTGNANHRVAVAKTIESISFLMGCPCLELVFN